MARQPRIVFPGIPHHITQRGNRKQTIFFSDRDRRYYLKWLCRYSQEYNLAILAYCLMNTHLHIVAVPEATTSFEAVFKPLHTRYASRINSMNNWTGHLFQSRFYSCPLDESHMQAAIRYVEQNPIRAGIVKQAEDYPWSSAKAHCGLASDSVLTTEQKWVQFVRSIGDWCTFLTDSCDERTVEILRRHTATGYPCGGESFIAKLEQECGRRLRLGTPGRPRRK